jgi:hypothetical protein
MPFFKSTFNILKKVDEDEVFETKWMDGNSVYVPPRIDWDYNREMQIEDVDIWEVVCEESGGKGVYAAWTPYAEFYMITTGFDLSNGFMHFQDNGRRQQYNHKFIETYYGPLAQAKVLARSKELGLSLAVNKVWVDDSEMWLHTAPTVPNKIFIPGQP